MASGARPPSSSPAPRRRSPAKASRQAKAGPSRNRSRAPSSSQTGSDRLVGGHLWRWRRWLGGVVLIGAAALAGGLYTLSRVPLPTARPLQQTTFVYDSSGHVLASFS